ncbi:acetyl/propionyl/methylcrotonyl-CoA carboxylase subunit alpha [Pseudofrankia inefficax]|uniref:Biotin-dependent 3-methylcrotonyl-coenzyme A carboxylase alpha1 subunit n=1 Tax=Pseudofrankia inefficax (strain DSM 45817 / CECT 9037 / DDB 130130 / EuI1c) TaxID=298654 RepID=E3J8V8_PSEI1|nr:biotin carboxylase N-terminal domain-containing protein [Pseudofrankia inefficax]ADP79691.1 Carbamoyl-phosphate synthase L chain ATP-binding protein [Pseudofrankia inefficax]
MFDTVLVANRGEIAVRVIRSLRALGIRSVAVYSDADAGARHVREADVAVRIGPAPARESYLNTTAVLAAAWATGAQAIHPGYGFLSENAAFAAACAEQGIVFVGPPAHAVEVMGDKITAKKAMVAAGVPVVPGRAEPGLDAAALAEAAEEIGFPVLLKPSAGGGGKGMRIVRAAAEMADAVASARREAAGAFGDDTLFLERYVDSPRHIEVQVLADAHGNVIHLGERECSLQRRHQKIIEEAPSALLTALPDGGAVRERIGQAAVTAAAAVGYVGAGTVEFIVAGDEPETFYFLEMNTRLQVEHPVTELVTGLDLVAEQLRVAAGEPLRVRQQDVTLTGHAVEARVYAEDPGRGFLPTGGEILALTEPTGEGVRVDSGVAAGTVVGSDYDPMLSKVIAWAPERAGALRRLDAALGHTVLLGVTTNIGFLRTLLANGDVRAGRLDTGLVERHLAELTAAPAPEGTASQGTASQGTASEGTASEGSAAPGTASRGSAENTSAEVGGVGPPADALAVYGLAQLLRLQPAGPVIDPWDVPSGWRVGEDTWLRWTLDLGAGARPSVEVRGTPAAAAVRIDGRAPIAAAARRVESPAGTELLVTLDGVTSRWRLADGPDGTLWVGAGGAAWPLGEWVREPGAVAAAAGDGQARSPMPGTVIAVDVAAGDSVAAGQRLAVVEAMKMEHAITAPVAGLVKDVLVAVGARVALDALLAVVEPVADPT